MLFQKDKVGEDYYGWQPQDGAISSGLTCCSFCIHSRSERGLVLDLHPQYGTTPSSTAAAFFFQHGRRDSRRISTSPRNLLMIKPLMRARSSAFQQLHGAIQLREYAARSISPASSTGASTSFAGPCSRYRPLFRLISAGLPAPSITIMSFSAARLL